MKTILLSPFLFFMASSFVNATTTDSTILLPLAGNTWATPANGNRQLITNAGIGNWTDAGIQFNTWLRISRPGTLVIRVKARSGGKSELQLNIHEVKKRFTVNGTDWQWRDAGKWQVKDTGYTRIQLSGLSKTTETFAEIASYEISGTAIDAPVNYVPNNEGNFFYWGRRGPSVHLNYPVADSIKAEWYYNEITVPEGQDVVGSYYMANGFGEGYFGIQVNSPTERRVLFSVWSPFRTDDPKSIPEDMRITMLKKGEGVHTGEFGNEGSGGQSFMRYNWQAGNTYKFLLRGIPDSHNNTTYTAYFFAPEKNSWLLIASFKRPKTNTWLKRFHSFLENFIPEQGAVTREVLFGNQWVCDASGQWIALNKAVFTYDNTAARGYRMDYAGGVSKGQFFLKNCGFFNQYTPYRSSFERPATTVKPDVDFTKLP